jgi:hypothetical protein
MNFKLVRKEYRQDGIFSVMTDIIGNNPFQTLEHAYQQFDNTYAPKIPKGAYTCIRGQHQLHSMTQPFTTFEVTNVPGHTNILLHVGNYNSDSDGCILLGLDVADTANWQKMITSSKEAFTKFMELQQGLDSFLLTVE